MVYNTNMSRVSLGATEKNATERIFSRIYYSFSRESTKFTNLERIVKLTTQDMFTPF